jgi:hypothetical protein
VLHGTKPHWNMPRQQISLGRWEWWATYDDARLTLRTCHSAAVSVVVGLICPAQWGTPLPCFIHLRQSGKATSVCVVDHRRIIPSDARETASLRAFGSFNFRLKRPVFAPEKKSQDALICNDFLTPF